MNNRCAACPLASSLGGPPLAPCLGASRPSVCGHVAREAAQGDARQRYWTGRVLGAAPRGLRVGDGPPAVVPRAADTPPDTGEAAAYYPALQPDVPLGPPPKLPRRRPIGLARELVVARFKEDVGWLDGLDAAPGSPSGGLHKTVYDMGPAPIPGAVRLPNRGREAGAMLAHIVRRYDDLADVTFFVQGKPHDADALAGRLSADYPADGPAIPLARHYLPYWPPAGVTALDRAEDVGGLETRWGRADFHGGRSPAENASWLASVWGRWFEGPRPDPWWFGYGAEWAVPRARILARPLAWWVAAHGAACAATMESRSWATDPAGAWAFELIWGYLLGDPAEYPTRHPVATARPATARPDVRLAMLAELCEYGSGSCGCGAVPRDCHHPDHPGKVFRRDCIACKQSEIAGA
jgi:hypothetical protein